MSTTQQSSTQPGTVAQAGGQHNGAHAKRRTNHGLLKPVQPSTELAGSAVRGGSEKLIGSSSSSKNCSGKLIGTKRPKKRTENMSRVAGLEQDRRTLSLPLCYWTNSASAALCCNRRSLLKACFSSCRT